MKYRPMQAKISFFIPAYNCAKTIIESIDSIMQTNFTDGDEVIIVDDCSCDDTYKVIRATKEIYPILNIIRHSRNKGGGATRNTAVENAKHNLLFCLDSDNVLKKNSIHPLKQFFINEDADVASFQSLHFFSKSIQEIDYIWTLKAGVFPKELALSKELTPGSSGNYLFTKESWLKAGGYPEYSGALDTWGFGIQQLLTGSKFVVLGNSYYYHRLLENSYYMRDAFRRQKSISMRATQILIPYFDQIDDHDINYILSKKNRNNWYSKLDQRPLKIVTYKKNKIYDGSGLYEKGLKKTFGDMLRSVKQRLRTLFSF